MTVTLSLPPSCSQDTLGEVELRVREGFLQGVGCEEMKGQGSLPGGRTSWGKGLAVGWQGEAA